MNPLLNKYEKVTYEHLKPICDQNGAAVFAKVRLKDVLQVDGSGISSEDYRFSLQSHFDFVVVDSKTEPLFVVEYDGAGHARPEQVARDVRKNALCERFGLSILRINSRYMDLKFRDLNLLTYFVEVWFMREAFDSAQKAGLLPNDSDFDPWLIVSDPNRKKRFPYWISADAQVGLVRLNESGKISDPIPSDYIGKDSAGSYRCLSWIGISSDQYAMVTTGMRAQQFPVVLADVLSQIAICDLHEKVRGILAGQARSTSEAVLLQKLASYENRYEMRARSGIKHHHGREMKPGV